ncbi:DUF5119 domain-containing protein [Bacteroides ovatus]|nr:DUF5119 domain-containing protein [Bacteroides ovatus]MCS3254277.1 DUF5119 domain-containing protein [Bacteroides ovatus]
MLWSDHAEGIGLNQETAAPTITLYPAVSVCRYTVEIRNAKNLKYVSGVGSSISEPGGRSVARCGSRCPYGRACDNPLRCRYRQG